MELSTCGPPSVAGNTLSMSCHQQCKWKDRDRLLNKIQAPNIQVKPGREDIEGKTSGCPDFLINPKRSMQYQGHISENIANVPSYLELIDVKVIYTAAPALGLNQTFPELLVADGAGLALVDSVVLFQPEMIRFDKTSRTSCYFEGAYGLLHFWEDTTLILSYSVRDSFHDFLGDPSLAAKFDYPAILYEEPSAKMKQAIQKAKHVHSL